MLEVSGLHAGYGRVPVIRGVDLKVAPGEIVLILGPNGAGKTTLLRTIAGFLRPAAGTIALAGSSILGDTPERLVGKGLRLVLDGHRVFPELTVADNIRLGSSDQAKVERLSAEVYAIFPVLAAKARSRARELSGGQQQMLALAQAFVNEPKVLLVDEPSLGLAQALIPPILAFLRRWAKLGVAILMVEQQIEIALATADRALVLERGQIALEGSAAALRRDRRVREIYLGLAEDRDAGTVQDKRGIGP